MKLECINDTFTPEQIQKIPNRPVKGEIYTLRGRVHTKNGLGYLLVELKNPMMAPDQGNAEQNFAAKRFVPVEDSDSGDLIEINKQKDLVKQ